MCTSVALAQRNLSSFGKAYIPWASYTISATRGHRIVDQTKCMHFGTLWVIYLKVLKFFLKRMNMLYFTRFSVTILDVNDNPPQLVIPPSCISITEFHERGQPITVIQASDADDTETANGQVSI